MNKGITVLVYPTKDVAKAKKLFAALLGVEPYVDSPIMLASKQKI